MDARAEALRRWVASNSAVTAPAATLQDLCDGIALAEIMTDMAPDFFDEGSFKRDVRDNTTLRERNVKKLCDGVREYYTDGLFLDLDEFPDPDAKLIAERYDVRELVKLMELVLGAAIKCDNKHAYIQAIMSLEPAVQATLMEIIQELMAAHEELADDTYTPRPSDIGGSGSGDYEGLHREIDNLRQAKKELETTNGALKLELASLRDELSRVSDEAAQLRHRAEQSSRYEEATPAGKQQAMKQEILSLKEAVFTMESEKLVAEQKAAQLKAQVDELQRHLVELQNEADQAAQYKDEADVLRHKAQRADQLEKTVEALKENMGEVSALRTRAQNMEQLNQQLLAEKQDLEEELSRLKAVKAQFSEHASSVDPGSASLALALEEAQRQALEARAHAEHLERENERHLNVIRDLQEKVDELELATGGGGLTAVHASASSNSLSSQIGDGNKEKLARLEADLAKERARADKAEQMLRAATRPGSPTEGQLTEKLLSTQQQLRDMTERYNALSQSQQAMAPQQENAYLEQINALLMEKNKLVSDNTQLSAQITRLSESNAAGPELEAKLESALHELAERKREIEKTKEFYEKRLARADDEARLISSSWYEIGVKLQRKALADRVNSGLAQGGSFLARQRDNVIGRYAVGN